MGLPLWRSQLQSQAKFPLQEKPDACQLARRSNGADVLVPSQARPQAVLDIGSSKTYQRVPSGVYQPVTGELQLPASSACVLMVPVPAPHWHLTLPEAQNERPLSSSAGKGPSLPALLIAVMRRAA
jgi:hypothetical protein